MNYDFDQVVDRRKTACQKWDFAKEVFGQDDVLPMWVADMDFASPPEVVDAIKKRAAHPIYGYTGALPSYNQAIVGWLKQRYDWEIDDEWTVTIPGVICGLSMSILGFTKEQDGVILQSPVYPPFFRVVEQSNRRVLNNQLVRVGERYEMDWADLEVKLTSGAKLLILCSPANPVGRVWSREELSRLFQMCKEHDVLIVSDEIHGDLVYSWSQHTPLGSLHEEARDNSITLIAPSKTFNIPGLSTAVAIIPNSRVRERFEKVFSLTGIEGVNLFGLTALEAAYTNGAPWLDALMTYLEGNLKYMEEYAASHWPGIQVIPAEGTYVIWLDCRDLGLEPEYLRRFLLEHAKVGLNNGPAFGPGGEGYQRINIATPRSILCEGLNRIGDALARLHSGEIKF